MDEQRDFLLTPIEFLKGVGPKRAEIFHKEFNIYTYKDLLHYYPYRHIDKSQIHTVADIVEDGSYIQLRGKISGVHVVGQKRGRRLVAIFTDDSGSIDLVWFNGIKWLEKLLQTKSDFILFGKPTIFNGHWNITHPELIDPQAQSESPIPMRFQPMYNTSELAKTRGLDSKAVAKLVAALLPLVKDIIPETLSDAMLNNLKMLPLREALVAIHYPEDNRQLSRAVMRLKFDELFFTQLRLLTLKLIHTQKSIGFLFNTIGDFFNNFYKKYLPFELTDAQKKVIREIRADVGSGHQMNRLLQGDVGSGKTIVALFIMLMAKDNGYQSCMMAPTEILATQHYEKISKQLAPLGMRVDFLSGSTRTARRKQILEGLQNGDVDVLIGTHALIEEDVKFHNLGLVVIDEQHRFGVEQRAKLWHKSSIPPHVLVMTATPIPRTLAMTVYGDLDVSVIDELPKGRKPIITKHLYDKDRLALFGFMKKQIALGRQIFVVYPLIQESEKMDLFDLMAGYDVMADNFPLPEYAIGLVHGKMKQTEKDFEMQRFLNGQTQILLSTTVIEVGIDVPNASVMVIENAERFGLSQLHQLRGRVGRGADQSYCLLMSGYKLTQESRRRLEAMVSTNDGFEIADIDLRLRGPGDIQGTQQSGMLDFKIADLSQDEKLVNYTRSLAMQLLEEDPELSRPDHHRMAVTLAKLMQRTENWERIS